MTSPQSQVISIIDAVAGCSCGSVALSGGRTLSGQFTGWSPALHRTALNFDIRPVDLSWASIRTTLAPMLERQHARRYAAGVLGHGTVPGGAIPLKHMLVDRLILQVTDIAAIRTEMARITSDHSMEADDRRMSSSWGSIEDGSLEDCRPRVRHKMLQDWGSFDGTRLHITRDVPDSFIPAMIGRPVSDILSRDIVDAAHTPLLDRIVKDAVKLDRGFDLILEGDWVPLFT